MPVYILHELPIACCWSDIERVCRENEVIHPEDHRMLIEKYPNNIKDLYGDIGVCEYGFEICNQICTFDYEYLKAGAIE